MVRVGTVCQYGRMVRECNDGSGYSVSVWPYGKGV